MAAENQRILREKPTSVKMRQMWGMSVSELPEAEVQAFACLWRAHILPPQQFLWPALAILPQQSAPSLQHLAPSLQQSAFAISLPMQQSEPFLQQAAPSLQQSALSDAFFESRQQLAPSLQQEAPSLQQAAFAWLSAGLSDGAEGAAVCAHRFRAKRNVTARVLNFIIESSNFAVSRQDETVHCVLRKKAPGRE
jgi:hypothetical protein